MANQVIVSESTPTVAANQVMVGDLWLQLSLRKLAVCVQVDPTVVFMEVIRGAVPTVTVAAVAGSVPAGGTGTAAGGWDTAGNRDTAITTIGEIKTQLNALMVALRQKGVIA